MKKYYSGSLLRIASAFTLIFFSCFTQAQNAKVQWIHNSAAFTLDTVDIYLDGTKIAEDLLYRSATGLLSTASGAHVVNINQASSADSGDQVISRQNLSIQANSNTVIMIAGVDSPASYAANPNSRNTDLKLVVRKGVLFSTSNAANCAISFLHGVTDQPGVSISTRPTGTAISISKLKYGDTTANLTPANTTILLDVKDTNGTILKTYTLPLANMGKKSATLFFSGFMDPLANQSGPAMTLLCVDTSGVHIPLTETARLQFVNNSPDVILDSVDFWINTTKVGGKIGFRAATTLLSVNAGTYDITVTKKNSPDTSGTNVVYRIPGYSFVSGKTYIGITSGVVDTTAYQTNPDGIDRSFRLTMADNYAETAPSSTQLSLLFHHGIPDAGNKAVDTKSAGALFGFTAYNGALNAANMSTAANQVLLIKSATETEMALRFLTSGKGGKTGVLLASGFKDTTGNKTGVKLAQYLVIYGDGTSSQLVSLASNVQVIHASADPAISSVNLFINGVLYTDSLAFRHATGFIPVIPFRPYRIHLTNLIGTDTTTAFYSTTLTPDTSKYYYAITSGLTNTTGFAANPAGLNRDFTLILNANARPLASFSTKNVDLMYLHNITDAPSTTAQGSGQTLFLSKDNAYRGFHGYNAHSALNDILFNVKDAVADTLLFNGLGMFENHKGTAGIVIATGFLNPSANQNGERARLFAFWPDGTSDTLNFTGIKDDLFNANSLRVYPNPATDAFHISIDLKQNASLTINLVDITGRELLSRKENSKTGHSTLSVKLPELETGIYILNIRAGDQSYSTKVQVIR